MDVNVRKTQAGADSFGNTWPEDGAVVPVPYEQAVILLAIQDGGFSVVEPPAGDPGADADPSPEPDSGEPAEMSEIDPDAPDGEPTDGPDTKPAAKKTAAKKAAARKPATIEE